MAARNQVGIGLSYRPPGYTLYTAWRNWFIGIDSWVLKTLTIRARAFSDRTLHTLQSFLKAESDSKDSAKLRRKIRTNRDETLNPRNGLLVRLQNVYLYSVYCFLALV
jgi:hypothetical protein